MIILPDKRIFQSTLAHMYVIRDLYSLLGSVWVSLVLQYRPSYLTLKIPIPFPKKKLSWVGDLNDTTSQRHELETWLDLPPYRYERSQRRPTWYSPRTGDQYRSWTWALGFDVDMVLGTGCKERRRLSSVADVSDKGGCMNFNSATNLILSRKNQRW